ncbi:MAG TPA: tetratricopeptide repeat protein, partial [Bryobacteraceae bacterium]|nr:tetratricopeptide repeat protein [Bryobacteraceae bacterium]
LGLALYRLNDFKESEKAFTKELSFQPPDPYSLYYLGRIRADQGQREQSISFFEKSLDAGEVLDVRQRLGSAYLALGRLDQAIRFLEVSVRARPEDGSVHYLLARAYQQKGRAAQAKIEFDAAARWKAKFRDDMISLSGLRSALAANNQAEAEARTRELAGSNDSDILLASATALGQAGLHQEAVPFLSKTISLNSAIPEAHYDLARAYIALDNRSAAMPELEKAVEIKPEFYEAQLLLGTLLADEGQSDLAIKHLRGAVQVRADNPKLLMMLGLQYYQHGYFADAIGVLQKASALEPQNPDASYLLIEAYYRNFEYERALALARETLARFPDRALSHYHLGAQLNNFSRLAEARQQLEMALAKDPGLVEAQSMLGDVLFKMGKADDSLKYFRQALATDPKLMDAQAGLGKALIQLRRYPEAAGAMEEALKIDPNLASLHLYLSQAYRALGRADDAKREAAVFSRLNQERANARDREGDRKYPN